MKKFPLLFNTWNGVAIIFGIFATLTWSDYHILSLVFSGLTISCILIPIYSELKTSYENKKVYYLSPILGVICWCILISAMIIYDPSEKIQIQSENAKDSLVNKSDTSRVAKTEPQKSKPKSVPPKRGRGKPDAQSTLPLPIENITFAIEQISSTVDTLPFSTRVIIQTNVRIEKPHLRIICATPIERGVFSFYPLASSIIAPDDGIILYNKLGQFAYDFYFTSPTFAPDTPLSVILYAKQPIKVTQVIPIQN